jgi:hypothetical protein
MTDSPEPVACSMDDDALKARQGSLLPGLVPYVRGITPTADGFRFEFAPSAEVLVKIAEVIEAERQCCRFFRFELVVEASAGPVTLTLSGPAGTREFLSSLLGGLA